MATPNFSNLRKLDVNTERTARYVFYQLEGRLWIESAPATEGNPGYFSALMTRSRRALRRMRRGGMGPEELAKNRDEDRKLYPKYVARSWGSGEHGPFPDADGKPVPFTQDNVRAFFEALPDWIFDDYRNWCADPQSFIDDDDALDEDELEEMEGN